MSRNVLPCCAVVVVQRNKFLLNVALRMIACRRVASGVA